MSGVLRGELMGSVCKAVAVVLIALSPAAASAAAPKPVINFTSSERFWAGGKEWIRHRLEVTNRAEFPDEMFAAAPNLPPCGLNKASSRTWIEIYADEARVYGFCALHHASDLGKLWFATEVGKPVPATAHIEINDRQTNTRLTSNRAVLPSTDEEPFGVRYSKENASKAYVPETGKPWRVTSQNSEYDEGRHYWTSYFRFRGIAGAKYKVTAASEKAHYAPALVLSTCYSFTGERVERSEFVPNTASDPSPVQSVILTPATSGDLLCSLSIDMLWAKNHTNAAAEAALPPPYSVTIVPQP